MTLKKKMRNQTTKSWPSAVRVKCCTEDLNRMTQSRARNQTARSGVRRANREAISHTMTKRRSNFQTKRRLDDRVNSGDHLKEINKQEILHLL